MRQRQKRLGGKRKLQLESKTYPVLLYKNSVKREEWNGGKETIKEIAQENFPKPKDLSVCSKRCH